MLEHYLSLATKAVFVENMALAFFLGMCSFLAVSKKVETAIGLGFAVIFVLGVTVPLNQILNEVLLKEGSLAWAGLPDVNLGFRNVKGRQPLLSRVLLLASPPDLDAQQ